MLIGSLSMFIPFFFCWLQHGSTFQLSVGLRNCQIIMLYGWDLQYSSRAELGPYSRWMGLEWVLFMGT